MVVSGWTLIQDKNGYHKPSRINGRHLILVLVDQLRQHRRKSSHLADSKLISKPNGHVGQLGLKINLDAAKYVTRCPALCCHFQMPVLRMDASKFGLSCQNVKKIKPSLTFVNFKV
ncbi:hypothetical protein AVEN_148300-1 [Araneus ventricosus]|uniref:Uncharacterized protein n=1 Tax=Araneus ventricosus TaxID=182803 RepID=A0A4Y2FWM0_ARAVE|nr:hypothetical protein AVEN_148300-1 [Araneus ventricosus]